MDYDLEAEVAAAGARRRGAPDTEPLVLQATGAGTVRRVPAHRSLAAAALGIVLSAAALLVYAAIGAPAGYSFAPAAVLLVAELIKATFAARDYTQGRAFVHGIAATALGELSARALARAAAVAVLSAVANLLLFALLVRAAPWRSALAAVAAPALMTLFWTAARAPVPFPRAALAIGQLAGVLVALGACLIPGETTRPLGLLLFLALTETALLTLTTSVPLDPDVTPPCRRLVTALLGAIAYAMALPALLGGPGLVNAFTGFGVAATAATVTAVVLSVLGAALARWAVSGARAYAPVGIAAVLLLADLALSKGCTSPLAALGLLIAATAVAAPGISTEEGDEKEAERGNEEESGALLGEHTEASRGGPPSPVPGELRLCDSPSVRALLGALGIAVLITLASALVALDKAVVPFYSLAYARPL